MVCGKLPRPPKHVQPDFPKKLRAKRLGSAGSAVYFADEHL